MKDSWRFLETGATDAYANMAIDEAMLIAYSQREIPPTLRIYGWRPPAFSFGYFQNPEQVLDIAKCIEENIPFVRRITGGGVIFHHQELTYSLVCSKDKIRGCDFVENSLKTICLFLINAYKKLGLSPKFAIEQNPYLFKRSLAKRKNSFCFASKEKYDVVINGKKLGGNSQRRRRNIIFQHGSIPLESDIDAITPFLKEKPMELKNNVCFLREVLGRGIEFLELKNILRNSFEETFSVNLQEEVLMFEEEKLFRQLKEEKYCSSEWNLHQIDNFRSIRTGKDDSL